MRTDECLTGRTRWRTERRVFKPDLTVLQVEVRFGDGPDDWQGMPTYLAGTGWRDATIDDVTHLSVVLRAPSTPQPTALSVRAAAEIGKQL